MIARRPTELKEAVTVVKHEQINMEGTNKVKTPKNLIPNLSDLNFSIILKFRFPLLNQKSSFYTISEWREEGLDTQTDKHMDL